MHESTGGPPEKPTDGELEARKKEEREFHNRLREVSDDAGVAETRWSQNLESTIQRSPLWANMKYYSVERGSRSKILELYEKRCPGKRVLDYCCGNGEDSILAARYGASEVVGIDISDTSVENCRNLACREGVEDIVRFDVMDAETTEFPDDRFDVITEYGSLHHLDLSAAMAELARIVTKDGIVICNEALSHNPLIHLYRRMTPKLRTPWEVDHILGRRDFQRMREYFGRIDLHFFHLLTLGAVPLRNHPRVFEPVLSVLERLDEGLLRVPGVRWQAWQVVFVLSEPHKD